MSDHIRPLRSAYDFSTLEQNNRIMVEYIWIGARGPSDMRSKSMALDTRDFGENGPTVEDLRVWNFDGSSTNQAPGYDSEVLLVPRKVYRDPFNRGGNLLVLCETRDNLSEPLPSNFRDVAKDVTLSHSEERSQVSFTQQYVLASPNSVLKRPVSWPLKGYPQPEGKYYCGVGPTNVSNRKIMEDHYKICLYAKINITSYNAGAMLGQWCYEIGASEVLTACDDLWMSRWLLMRLAEGYNCNAVFDYRLVKGDWSPSTAITSFSTVAMRGRAGLKAIETATTCLKSKHSDLVPLFGLGRTDRDDCDGSLVTIPSETMKASKGFLRDARMTANFDPYLVSAAIIDAICNEGQRLDNLNCKYQQLVDTYPDV
mmetsp:Transcript_63810/g.73160  ORF Transcript_63810/g.73160 Transcript_63810/m.73160 type:complete len:370 (+) Transcript_63810:112-1221(+)